MANGCGPLLVKQMIPRFTSFNGRESSVNRRLRLETWFTECLKAVQLFRGPGNASGYGSNALFYSGLVKYECNDTLGWWI